MQKTIVFMGSKPVGYECLEWLISQKDQLNLHIAGLLTRQRREFGEGHDLAALAAAHGIPVFANLAELPECDIIYSVQYHEIIRQEHIARARQVAVNLHMAPLPEYRGANQFSFAIIDEKKEFGTTIHKIDTRIDHGDILFQQRFPMPGNCWVGDLYQLTYDASLQLFRHTLADVVNGNYTPVPQETLIPRYGTSLHYRKEMDTLKVIDPTWPKDKIDRYVRATAMPGFEPPYSIVNNKKVYYDVKPL